MLPGVGSHHGLIRPCKFLHQVMSSFKTNMQVFNELLHMLHVSWRSCGLTQWYEGSTLYRLSLRGSPLQHYQASMFCVRCCTSCTHQHVYMKWPHFACIGRGFHCLPNRYRTFKVTIADAESLNGFVRVQGPMYGVGLNCYPLSFTQGSTAG